MESLLISSMNGDVGLAVFQEARKIQKLVFDKTRTAFTAFFENGDIEPFVSKIDPAFFPVLASSHHIVIAHFPDLNIDREPTKEYDVPIRTV